MLKKRGVKPLFSLPKTAKTLSFENKLLKFCSKFATNEKEKHIFALSISTQQNPGTRTG